MNKKHIYFTSEAVSEGHPDKVADQISDAVLDAYLAKDPESKVACETLVTTGQVVIAGEVRSSASVDVPEVARKTIKRIGYDKPEYMFDGTCCGIINLLHEQSADINRGVVRADEEKQGAGDQGMMFGYATNETENYMPLPLYLANLILLELKAVRKEGKQMKYLRPDAKSQVTVEYDENGKPVHIDTIVVSTQHDEFYKSEGAESQEEVDEMMHNQIEYDVEYIVLQRVKEAIADDALVALFDENTKLLVNPTGKFVIGGPHGDTGLTGRKIIVDTYGGKGAHGGGAFSGKDPSKVDRSAAYMARYIAKNMVAAGVADQMLIQLSYAIGVAEPTSVNVETYGTNHTPFTDAELASMVATVFDLRPYAIIRNLDLKHVKYEPTAAYGHFGREAKKDEFTWERLDAVDTIKQALNLK
ncbi:methionine adenosyltransferase [Prevotella lacticifex]|uniref:S-adenosylmethionine synthase n=1 Tax=Prevotella lacticifex TaxID=2854755 RepID=A0A9R1CX13_9BACT|nr:methionine adenosyltransferase [Prevotella lacticifex]GJG35774.1 S-adenosylmethionine synthase [Prevotella lacticifex]GJG39177.1 S-adenosylmethionine synthase [Prevotella lacticifex]GJG42143.1 S-adenosylmethionine synthase [Prevotella lacticifex]GJG45531.1 S-adenosylmethionine synthase [Prevotella lacticifex]GJG48494.1 S-adenosylmethionine synthase [Prevotella lacticifex]